MKSINSIVYLIEDDEGSRESTVCLLNTHDFQTKSFATAEQFLSEVVEKPNGCILTDLVLPGMSGLELFQRTIELGWATPAILLTAFGDVPTVVRAFQQGIYDFVEKPFPSHRLIQSISACLKDGNDRKRSASSSLT